MNASYSYGSGAVQSAYAQAQHPIAYNDDSETEAMYSSYSSIVPPQYSSSHYAVASHLATPVPRSQELSYDSQAEWQRQASGYPTQPAPQPAYRLKAESLPLLYTGVYDRQGGYGLPPVRVSEQVHSDHQQSPTYVPVSSDYAAGHYFHSGDISPCTPISPLRMDHSHSQAPQPGCDPRHVSGEPFRADEGLMPMTEEDGDADGDEEQDLVYVDNGTGSLDEVYDDDEYDLDYEDERDGEYVLRVGRSRSGSQRYSPYEAQFPSAYSQENALGISTRARRTTSNATDTSVSSASSTSSYLPRRRSRPSVALPMPVPVPNLTKKSRGRRVPTATSHDVKSSRIHTCKVPGCGKCFARGEHLKRHVRSIHTYEKPHKCPYPGCDKDFSRHDNLGQHMRVHKDYRRQ